MVIVGGALAYAETHPIAVLAAVAGIAFIAWVVQHNRRGS
jgi:hypothetical protein